MISLILPAGAITKGGELMRRASSRMLRRSFTSFPPIAGESEGIAEAVQRRDLRVNDDKNRPSQNSLGRSKALRTLQILSLSLSPARASRASLYFIEPSIENQRSFDTPSLASSDSMANPSTETGMKTPPGGPSSEFAATLHNDNGLGLMDHSDPSTTDLGFGYKPEKLSRSTFMSSPPDSSRGSPSAPATVSTKSRVGGVSVSISPNACSSGADFAHAVQQACHAECEPGTTSDLLSIVLDRKGGAAIDSTPYSPAGNGAFSPSPSRSSDSDHSHSRSQGRFTSRRKSQIPPLNPDAYRYLFRYAEFPLGAKIWYGTEDDKISEKGIRWLESTLGSAADPPRTRRLRSPSNFAVEERHEHSRRDIGKDAAGSVRGSDRSNEGGERRVEVVILEGEGHNLMSRGSVMFEAFKSLAEEMSIR
jgi:hypothetical protein